MKLGRLNHVGVATPSIEKSVVFYREVIGADEIHEPFDLAAQGVKVCFVDTPNSQIELIEPLGETCRSTASSQRTRPAASTMSAIEVPDIHEAKAGSRRRARRCSANRGSARTAPWSSPSIRRT